MLGGHERGCPGLNFPLLRYAVSTEPSTLSDEVANRIPSGPPPSLGVRARLAAPITPNTGSRDGVCVTARDARRFVDRRRVRPARFGAGFKRSIASDVTATSPLAFRGAPFTAERHPPGGHPGVVNREHSRVSRLEQIQRPECGISLGGDVTRRIDGWWPALPLAVTIREPWIHESESDRPNPREPRDPARPARGARNVSVGDRAGGERCGASAPAGRVRPR